MPGLAVAPPTRAHRPAGSRLVSKYLLPAERVIVALRLHWLALWVPIAIAVGGFVLALALDVALPASAALARDVLWLAWAASLWYLGWHYLNWWSDRFVVTDKRVMWVHGLLNRNADMMPLSKVTDMRYERTVPGRIFGYGSFIMESAGQDQALSRIDHIVEPDWLYREVCAQLFTPDAVAHSTSGGGPSDGRAWPGYGPNDPDPAAVATPVM
ncbi:MAG: PH domain-containing protein [Sporichthyaceae bacterium]